MKKKSSLNLWKHEFGYPVWRRQKVPVGRKNIPRFSDRDWGNQGIGFVSKRQRRSYWGLATFSDREKVIDSRQSGTQREKTLSRLHFWRGEGKSSQDWIGSPEPGKCLKHLVWGSVFLQQLLCFLLAPSGALVVIMV